MAAKPVAKRLVVLVSGSGTNLQALLDAITVTGAEAYGAEIVAVGADREGIEGLARDAHALDELSLRARRFAMDHVFEREFGLRIDAINAALA